MGVIVALSPLLIAAASAADRPCEPIPGWDQVLTEEVRWIVVGELHGNNETPALFADAVCLTARSRPVVVALEQPSTDQPAIDSFLVSDGGPEATRAFLKAMMWRAPMKDGRSSEATFRLFENLRQMHAAGLVRAVIAFQPAHLTGYPGPAEYERVMAETAIAGAEPDAVTL